MPMNFWRYVIVSSLDIYWREWKIHHSEFRTRFFWAPQEIYTINWAADSYKVCVPESQKKYTSCPQRRFRCWFLQNLWQSLITWSLVALKKILTTIPRYRFFERQQDLYGMEISLLNFRISSLWSVGVNTCRLYRYPCSIFNYFTCTDTEPRIRYRASKILQMNLYQRYGHAEYSAPPSLVCRFFWWISKCLYCHLDTWLAPGSFEDIQRGFL